MKKECASFPNLNHEDCELDFYETAVADYFESRGLSVERLCVACLSEGEKAPDFRITDASGQRCLCEVKKLESSTGAPTKSDWEYDNRTEFELLIEDARKTNVPLIATPDQIKYWKGEIPYPKRSTEEKERAHERAIIKLLQQSPVANQSLEIIIHRDDPWEWTDEEQREFVDNLVKNLELISKGPVPWDWNEDLPGMITSHYDRERDDGWRIRNFIEVRRTGHSLVVKSHSYLGVNWKAVEDNCHQAQKQIRDRLKREPRPEEVARLVVLFLKANLVFLYVPHIEKLVSDVDRHVLSKFPDLSAVAFCMVSEIRNTIALSLPPQGGFLVFPTASTCVPSIASHVFDDGHSWVTQR
jgi:hypothetical protein